MGQSQDHFPGPFRSSVIPPLPSFPPSVIPPLLSFPHFRHSCLPPFPPSAILAKAGIHYALQYDKLPAARLYGFPLPDRGRGAGMTETMRAYPETGTMRASPENEKTLVISTGKMYQFSPQRRRSRAFWYSESGRGAAESWYAKVSSHGSPG